jgi:acid stress chaperone HdeB
MLDGISEKMRMKIKFVPALAVAAGLILALETVPAARAQVTIDVSKITCDQYIGYKVTNPENIAIWLSGYYHGKRGDTTLDTQDLVAKAKKVRGYCFRNPQTLVMQAVETLFGETR